MSRKYIEKTVKTVYLPQVLVDQAIEKIAHNYSSFSHYITQLMLKDLGKYADSND